MFIALGVGGAVALFLAFVVTRPSTFRVERSATMHAPPRAVFGQVNDLHNWDDWSPWAKLDPNMRLTHSGPASGVGAGYAWEGNKQAGKGSLVITDSVPGERVELELRFEKPFRSVNQQEFTFTAEGGGTRVRWVMSGRKNFLFKLFGLFMDVDKLVGRDFETGLANMRAVVERPSLRAAA